MPTFRCPTCQGYVVGGDLQDDWRLTAAGERAYMDQAL